MTVSIFGEEISYERFINDLASKVVSVMKAESEIPEFICQRQAYRMFGRANVERWRRTGKVTAYRRQRKIEYRTADLKQQQDNQQDY